MRFPHALRLLFLPLGALLFGLGLSGCGSGGNPPPPGSNPPPVVHTPKTPAPAFSSDSAYAFIEKQLAFGYRIPNTPEHTACAEWLAAKLKQYGAEVTVQKAVVTDAKGVKRNIRNIIGSINPSAARRILLSAHWDSRPVADEDPQEPTKPVPGANDAGSGVGVLLEVARQLQANPQPLGVDIIFWDAEDLGEPESNVPDTYGLGSQYWSRNPHKPGYRAEYGINLDMVGASGARFYLEPNSEKYAASVNQKVWNAAGSLGHDDYFALQNSPHAITDDHLYVNTLAHIPTIDVIHTELEPSLNGGHLFFPYWHTRHDDMSVIDRNTLQAVGETLLLVIRQEGGQAASAAH